MTCLRLAPNDAHLFVAGADGSLVMFEVKEAEGRTPTADGAMGPSNEVLITKLELEEKANVMSELKNNIEELNVNSEYAIRMQASEFARVCSRMLLSRGRVAQDINFQERMKKVTDKYASELEQGKQQYDLLSEEKTDLEREAAERIATLEVRTPAPWAPGAENGTLRPRARFRCRTVPRCKSAKRTSR